MANKIFILLLVSSAIYSADQYKFTIPEHVIAALGLKPEDDIFYEVRSDKTVSLRKATPLDIDYPQSAEQQTARTVDIGDLTGKRYSIAVAPEGVTATDLEVAYKTASKASHDDTIKIIAAWNGRSFHLSEGRKYKYENLSQVSLRAVKYLTTAKGHTPQV